MAKRTAKSPSTSAQHVSSKNARVTRMAVQLQRKAKNVKTKIMPNPLLGDFSQCLFVFLPFFGRVFLVVLVGFCWFFSGIFQSLLRSETRRLASSD